MANQNDMKGSGKSRDNIHTAFSLNQCATDGSWFGKYSHSLTVSTQHGWLNAPQLNRVLGLCSGAAMGIGAPGAACRKGSRVWMIIPTEECFYELLVPISARVVMENPR